MHIYNYKMYMMLYTLISVLPYVRLQFQTTMMNIGLSEFEA